MNIIISYLVSVMAGLTRELISWIIRKWLNDNKKK